MTSQTTDRRSTIRNLVFDMEGVPRHWNGGRKSVTAFFDGLSIFFPVGERFFMKSVRAHAKHVTSDALAAEVRAFCGQEGMHGREHERYNAMLEAQGYPAKELEAKVVRLLDYVEKNTPKRWKLAATCALEHMTSLMAQMLLGDPRSLEGADPTMAALWKWHAAEENEHRAVAYDVYLAAGGTYAERVFVMAVASAIFYTKVAEHQVRFMRADGTLYSLAEWAALGRYLFVEPGVLRSIARLYLAYYRPGFHPSHVDADALIDRWADELRVSEVYARAAA